MGGAARRIGVLVGIAALGLGAACSGSGGSSKSDGDGEENSSVAFENLDEIFESIPPGGGDDWTTYRDDFTAPESGLGDFTFDTSTGTKGDGTFTLTLRDPNDLIVNSSFGGRSRKVTVQATVGSSGTATDAGHGVLCRRDGNSYFYAGVGKDGTYAIGRAADGTRTVLTGGGQWIRSPAVAVGQDAYTVRLTCNEDSTAGTDGPIVVTLTVNGQAVDSVSAADTGGTDAGVFLLSFEQPDAAATFTSFLVATGELGAEDDPGRLHDYQRLVLNQPSTLGSCRMQSPGYFHTRFPAAYVARCATGSYLPGTSVTFFAFRETADSPKSPATRARAVYRALLRRVGLESTKDEEVTRCASRGAHQGELLGVDADNRLRTEGAFACGTGKNGRTFVVSYAEDLGRADVAIAVVPPKQRAAFAAAVTRDFPGIPTLADNIAFDE